MTREHVDHPAWLASGRHYYSKIDWDRTDPVSVFRADNQEEVSSSNPGMLCLSLQASGRVVRVVNAAGHEEGVISPIGTVPGVRYAMHRNGRPVWVLSVRSLVRKRHRLEPTSGETWIFETPFFWQRQVIGSINGVPKLLGYVGPTKMFWLMWIEPGNDTLDVLSAVAFMHRNWWRW